MNALSLFIFFIEHFSFSKAIKLEAGIVRQPQLGTPASHIKMPGVEFNLLLHSSPHIPGRPQMLAQVLEFLPHTGD